MSRLILVSNRLPFTLKEGKLVRSSGGLVAGLGPIHDSSDSLWIGTLGEPQTEELREALDENRLVAVDLPREVADRHYGGFSNQVLWPLFHYLLENVNFLGADFAAYRHTNLSFAEAILEHAGPTDTIWIHDYHLMLLPTILREQLPHATIGFFLHIPFPSSEVFRILPRKEEILHGLLGADLLGVHTYDYGRHLVTSFRRVLGIEFGDDWSRSHDGGCKVGVFPIGVDAKALEARGRTKEVGEAATKLVDQYSPKKVVLGVDRLDYTKGLVHRLRAYRYLLETEPRWQKEAVLIQLAVPTRSSIESYKSLKEEIDRLVGEINGDFGSAENQPVNYIYRSISEDDLAALYRLADVCWVTPVRDGMNLVAKEYVAYCFDDRGVLALSEFAGAAAEMGEALLHNPWDIEGSAACLSRALLLEPTEAAQRMQALRRRVRANDVHRWVERFLETLSQQAGRREAASIEKALVSDARSGSWTEDLVVAFTSAPSAILALDYDGTLVEIQPHPEDAYPPGGLRELLSTLGQLPRVEVLIVSGRDPETLDRWFGGLPINMIAEHGLHSKLHGETEWEMLLSNIDMTWKESVRDILEEYTARCPGSLIEDKYSSLAWHYRRVELSFGSWQARELVQHLSEAFANSALEVLHGSKVVEIRPQGFNKGVAFSTIRDRLGEFALTFGVGDDRTDEDLFEVLDDGAWSVKVGRGPTRARYSLSSPKDLRELLQRMATARAAAESSHAP